MSENTEEKAGPTAEPGGERLPAKRQGVTLGQLVTYSALDLVEASLKGYFQEQAEQLSRAALSTLQEPLLASASKVAQTYKDMLSASAAWQFSSLTEQITQQQEWLASIAPQQPAFMESFDLLAGHREALARSWIEEAVRIQQDLQPAAARAQVTKFLTYVETEPAPEIRVTQAGAYVELEPAPPQQRRPAPAVIHRPLTELEERELVELAIKRGRLSRELLLALLEPAGGRGKPGPKQDIERVIRIGAEIERLKGQGLTWLAIKMRLQESSLATYEDRQLRRIHRRYLVLLGARES